MKVINVHIEYQPCEDSYGCNGIKGANAEIPTITNGTYFGHAGDFQVYLSHKKDDQWHLHIWSKDSKRCKENAFCYAEVLNFKIVELNGELYGDYILPVKDICNNIEKSCGKLFLKFN